MTRRSAVVLATDMSVQSTLGDTDACVCELNRISQHKIIDKYYSCIKEADFGHNPFLGELKVGTWDVSPSILIQFKSTVNVFDISVRDNIIEVCFSKWSQMYFCCRHFSKTSSLSIPVNTTGRNER